MPTLAKVVSSTTVHLKMSHNYPYKEIIGITDHARIWASLYAVAQPIVRSYHSDLYYDAITVSKFDHTTKDFWYCIGENGTHMLFDYKDHGVMCSGRELAFSHLESRPYVYHCQFIPAKDKNTLQFAMSIVHIPCGHGGQLLRWSTDYEYVPCNNEGKNHMTAYYDTEKLPRAFYTYRFLASGKDNWDFFLSPTCPYVYYIAKVVGSVSGAWGTLTQFLAHQKSPHPIVDYLLPLSQEYRQCQNPPINTHIPKYKRPMPCCPDQRTKA